MIPHKGKEMNIVKQSVRILATNLSEAELPFSYDHPEKLIEYAGRLCYKTEDRQTTDSWIKFLEKRREQGHKSIFEHAWEVWRNEPHSYLSQFLFTFPTIRDLDFEYVAGNRVAFDEERNPMVRAGVKVTNAELASDEFLIKRFPEAYAITAHFVTNRGVAFEFVRHRFPVSFSQESTRFVRYKNGITVIEQDWFKDKDIALSYSYRSFLHRAEDMYLYLLDNGVPPEIARDVLPHATKAELIVTTHLPEWRHIIRQRTAKEAHPQFRELMGMFVEEVKKVYPQIMED